MAQTNTSTAYSDEEVINQIESHYGACNEIVVHRKTSWTAAIIERRRIIEELESEVNQVSGERDSALASVDAANSTISSQSQTITNLQDQVAQLQIDLAAAQAQLNQQP